VISGIWGAEVWAADAASPANPLPEIRVIGTTPVPGTAIDIDKIPGNVISSMALHVSIL